jgi:methylated-DNA-protein-cysteine methyltransferase related protein
LRKNNAGNFFEIVYKVVRQVPKGKVTTYSAIAKYLGVGRGARAVGWAMRDCRHSDVPCHRVVRSDGFISGDPESANERALKLSKEGIEVKDNFVDLAGSFYDNFRLKT